MCISQYISQLTFCIIILPYRPALTVTMKKQQLKSYDPWLVDTDLKHHSGRINSYIVCATPSVFGFYLQCVCLYLRPCTAALNELLGPTGGSSTDDDLLLMTPEPGSVPSLTPTLTPSLHPSMSAMQPQLSRPPAIQWDVGASYEEKQDALPSSLRPEIGIKAWLGISPIPRACSSILSLFRMCFNTLI